MTTTLKVLDQFRTNYLSRKPGGTSVIVVYKNGRSYEYDKIKNIDAYIKKTLENPEVSQVYRKVN